jgi:NAD(P)-dependent dehydrogenase (short-subunit alcohol dehydrogenase family)
LTKNRSSENPLSQANVHAIDPNIHRGKVVIVTGAAIGNGQAFVERFAAQGAQVVIADIADALETAERVAEIAGALAPLLLKVDVTDKFGRIDVLVNNAGIYDEEPFELLSLATWKKVLDVNLTGLFLATQAVLPCMKSQGYGRIINLSSNTVWLGTPYLVHYVTSKMGVIGFTRALASEVGEYGITVNALTIGLTATQRPPGARLMQGSILEHLMPPQAIKQAETPEDIAKVVSFLASESSNIITGQTINVDGGVARH